MARGNTGGQKRYPDHAAVLSIIGTSPKSWTSTFGGVPMLSNTIVTADVARGCDACSFAEAGY